MKIPSFFFATFLCSFFFVTINPVLTWQLPTDHTSQQQPLSADTAQKAKTNNSQILTTAEQPIARKTAALIAVTSTQLSPIISPISAANQIVDWRQLPVIPVFTPKAQQIYQAGLLTGNHPHAFSKIGSCESATTWFLTPFEQGDHSYNLGNYSDLQTTIDYFAGSFSRQSLGAGNGFTTANLLSPLWNNPKECEATESPLSCEYRSYQPSFALISIGTNDVAQLSDYEPNLREIIEQTIAANIVPILATKADNLEQNDAINTIIARLALEYDLPPFGWVSFYFFKK